MKIVFSNTELVDDYDSEFSKEKSYISIVHNPTFIPEFWLECQDENNITIIPMFREDLIQLREFINKQPLGEL